MKKPLFTITLILMLVLSGCGRPAAGPARLPVGSLWAAPASEGGLNWEQADAIAQEQHAGYALASQQVQGFALDAKEAGEGNQQDDVQAAIRKMAEKDNVAAVLGPTSNEATMAAASLVNFFNVPLVVPSADGSSLFPSNNLWAFRLSPQSSDYAAFLFGSLLNKVNFDFETAARLEESKIKAAILYEENTFGESAAVATAKAAMQQPVSIEVYASFPSQTVDPERMSKLVRDVRDANASLVYLVCSDPQVALALIRAFEQVYQPEALPVLVGQAGGFASAAFLSSPQAEGVLVLRQQIDPEGCPVEAGSLYQAQAYAAAYLLNQVVQEARSQTPAESALSFVNRQERAQLAALRETVRNQLKQVNGHVPCIGKVAFDTTGQNKIAQIELVRASSGALGAVTMEEFHSLVLGLAKE